MALFLENDPATVRASSPALGSSLCQCELDHNQPFNSVLRALCMMHHSDKGGINTADTEISSTEK